MMKTLRLILFAVASLLILSATAWHAVRAEIALHYGTPHRMKIQGFDPHDPFRGRYLAFSMPGSARSGSLPDDWNSTGYVTVERGPDGLSFFGAAGATPPASGDYLAVRTRGYSRQRGEKSSSFAPPFSRFYLNEKLAPEAERILNAALRDPKRQAVIAFRVHRGYAALEDMEVDGQSIVKLAREAAARTDAAPQK